MPVSAEKLKGLKLAPGEVPGMSVFEDTDTIEVPFKYPGKEYAGNQPWFYHSLNY